MPIQVDGLDSKLKAARPFKILLASWSQFHAGAEMAGLPLAVGLRDVGHEVLVNREIPPGYCRRKD